MDALHLTEANRNAIRDLVRKISPHFEEEVWERVKIRQKEEQDARELADYYQQKQAQAMSGIASQMAQAQWATYGGPGVAPSPNTILTTTTSSAIPSQIWSGTSAVSPVVFSGLANTGTAITTPGFASYAATGPEFTAYDKLVDKAVAEMGLTKKGGGWSK